MQNDPSAPGAPPSRGFASIITLVSDVSKDLAALEQAPPEPPPPPRVAPSPPRTAPPPPQPPPPQPQADPWAAQRRSNTGTYFSYVKPEAKPQPADSDWGEGTWFYMLVAFIVFMVMVLFGK